MKVTIDQEKCIGCGSCQAICPDGFEIADDNKAHLKNNSENVSCLKEGADICPVQAIELEE